MTKVSRKPLPKDFGLYVNNLWSAFTLLDSKADIRLLFKDLFTRTEFKMFAKRLEIARRLLSLQTYERIRKELAVTDATTSTVSDVLSERGDGYRKVHFKLLELEKKQHKAQARRLDRMSNPFKYKPKRTVLGVALGAGLRQLDKTIQQKTRQRSARKTLEL
jgi:uncharacterized protein YerC